MSRLKELRKSRGMSQEELAKVLKISQQSVSRIESKNELLSTSAVIEATKFFNITADYLLGLSEERHNQVCEDRMYRYFMENEQLLLEYADLKEEYQEAVMAVIKTLTARENKEDIGF